MADNQDPPQALPSEYAAPGASAMADIQDAPQTLPTEYAAPSASAMADTPDPLNALREKIIELLLLCAQKEVDVPIDLKRALLGEKAAEECEMRRHVLLEEQENANNRKEEEENELVKKFRSMSSTLGSQLPSFDLRVENGSYSVSVPDKANDPLYKNRKSNGGAKQDIKTVKNSNIFYYLGSSLVRCFRAGGNPVVPKKEKVIMHGVNVYFEPSKMYLVLGAPGSGKSTFMKIVAQQLSKEGATIGGKVTINGVSQEKGVYWNNLVGYIDQIDRLHSWLTVYETCEFAFQCRSGGTHREPWFATTEEADKLIQKMDEEHTIVTNILEGFGLTRVKDTFVGDPKTVRGVSGGEKKRVTVAEMLCGRYPIFCCDEISTGLDAATTYDITKLMSKVCRIRNNILIVSLLQPPPETVANFDEVILLSEGKVIYSGPVADVLAHFQSLGYELPDRMDVADWLQALPTPDGAAFLKGAHDPGASMSVLRKQHLTSDEFMQKFYESERGQEIMDKLGSEYFENDASFVRSIASQKYRNSPMRSLSLVMRRELLLWWRDKYQIKQKFGQNIFLGVVVGTIFWQANTNSIIGVLFQSMFVNVLGAMLLVVKQFPARSIFYKQQDANFFPPWCYVVGRMIATIPTSIIDAIVYGTIIFWFAGLSYNDGATVGNFFMFLLILFATSTASAQMFSFFSAVVGVITFAQAAMAVTFVVMVLFCGFTIQANLIPPWWIWAYWINPVAWTFRALAVNEFDSGAYDAPASNGHGLTQGEAILVTFGFTYGSANEPFSFAWAWYGIAFLIGVAVFFVVASSFALRNIRFATGKVLVTEELHDDSEDEVDGTLDESPIPFKRVDLTFRNIQYSVKSSISKERLELLKGVDGVVQSGTMTALMGSSGAGKTTLMDVLAMRKSTGEIDGEICLNGHPQEEDSFRRCMGYVEQFDEQSEQLTIRETVEFSAKLRLDRSNLAVTKESRTRFVELTLKMLELNKIENLQVGSDETGGLSFEQRKRLSIAVEVVANPSILFLDEPTSGLDARAAMIVMRGLRRIAKTGRAVCATIHQPSISIFSDFDRLLLLKRGGEVVFFGDLGEGCVNLINYFERYDATPKIKPGENPATWMLTSIGAGSAGSGKLFDYAGSYKESKLHQECIALIEQFTSKAIDDGKVSFPTKYATSVFTQASVVFSRGRTVYYRSPNYNVTRNIVSVCVAVLFGSAFIWIRVPTTEGQINSIVNAIFVSVLFTCVSSQNTVLSFFEKERNIFYRHKAAGMYDAGAIIVAVTLAEIPFIFLSAFAFVVPFYFIMGFANSAAKFFLFYCYVFLGFTSFTFSGQMFVSLLRDAETAQAVGGLWVTFSVLFSGILIKPNQIPAFWTFCYWLFPGHYLFEALYMTQFYNDQQPITPSVGSPLYKSIPGCVDNSSSTPCVSTVAGYFAYYFSNYNRDHVYYCAIYLVLLIIFTRIVTYLALSNLNYRST